MNGAKLQVKNICVCRAGKLIVNNVSFEAQPGQLTAIVGPNGAGKTTLMRTLTGERPDRGQVLINGEDMYENPEYWLQKIGYVPVDNVLHEHLILWEALMYIGRLRRPELSFCECEAKVDKLLTEFGFPTNDARRHRQIRRLSTGERKRANICSELLLDPPILLLDEPTSGLDPDAEWNLMDWLARYAHEHKQTILIITHTLNTLHFCDKVIFVENARGRAVGTPVKVLEELENQINQTKSDLFSRDIVSTTEITQRDTNPRADLDISIFSRWAKIFSKYKTDEDKRKDCTFLFSIDLKYEKDLELGILSEKLLHQFSNFKINIDNNANIIKVEERKKWLIKYQDQAYIIKKDDNELSVYRSSKNISENYTKKTSSVSHQLKSVSWSYQLHCLLSRYIKVRLGDKWGLIGTILAGFSGLLFFILPSRAFIKPFDPSEIGLALTQARQSIYVVALVVTLTGLITSYTEISKEFRIYRHERLKGLSPSAYFISKWIWLTVIVGILTPLVLMGFIVLIYQQPLPGFDQPRPEFGEVTNWWESLFRFQMTGLFTKEASWLTLTTLVFACIASVTLGLLLSALAGDSGRGYLYLSFVVVFIVLFSGLIRNEKLDNIINLFSFASTGRWAYEGVASSIGIYCWSEGWRFDEFNSIGHIVSVWLSLIIYILIAGLLTIIVLRIRDPWYTRWMNLGRFLNRNWKQMSIYLSIVVLLLSYTAFLRHNSFEYHLLTYFSKSNYGGTGAVKYAKIEDIENPNLLQFSNGKISQTLCQD
jgi:ABC-type multidrug transport system ATPase subunit